MTTSTHRVGSVGSQKSICVLVSVCVLIRHSWSVSGFMLGGGGQEVFPLLDLTVSAIVPQHELLNLISSHSVTCLGSRHASSGTFDAATAVIIYFNFWVWFFGCCPFSHGDKNQTCSSVAELNHQINVVKIKDCLVFWAFWDVVSWFQVTVCPGAARCCAGCFWNHPSGGLKSWSLHVAQQLASLITCRL